MPDLLAFRASAIFPTIVLREGIIGRMVSIDTIDVNLFFVPESGHPQASAPVTRTKAIRLRQTSCALQLIIIESISLLLLNLIVD